MSSYPNGEAYVIFLIDADMGSARVDGQSRNDWVKAQVKARNHKDAAAYIRHLIERDQSAKSPRASVPLASADVELLSHLLYIRKGIDDLHRRLDDIVSRDPSFGAKTN